MTSSSANVFNFVIVLVAALGSFTFGFSNAVVGGVFGLPSFFAYFNISLESQSAQVNQIIGAQNGLFFGGGFLGCFIVAYLPDKVGRIRNIQFTCVTCVIGSILQGAATHIAMLLVGRFLTGLGAGMVNCSIPLYQAEVAPPKQRGRMVGSHGVMLSAGFAFAGWAGYGCYYEPNHDVQWRLLLCLQVVSPAILLAVTPWLPESPRWLVLNDKTDLAFRTLKRLHGASGDRDDTIARDELIQIFAQIELEKAKSRSLISMLRIPSYRRRLLTGFFIQFLCQSSGVTVINNYSVMLYTMLGIPSDVQLLIYAIWLTWSCISNLIGSLIVDRLGRVRMFKIGFVSSVVALSIYTGLMSVYSSQESKVGSGVALAFAFLFLGCFGIFVDAVSYIYVGEIFPLFMRATGISFSISGWFSAALVYNEVAATAFNRIGWRYNLVFICITVVSLPVIIFLLPETKNMPLEEVSRLFGDEVAPEADQMTAEDKQRIVQDLLARGTKGDDVVQDLVGTRVEMEKP